MPGLGSRRPVALVLLAAILLGGGYFLTAGSTARLAGHFQSAQHHLDRGRGMLKKATSEHQLTLVHQAQREFQAADDEFAAVLGDPVLRAAGHSGGLPIAGSPLTARTAAVDQLAWMGRALTDAALRSADIDARLVAGTGRPDGESGAKRLLALLQEAQGGIDRIRADLEAAQRFATRVNLDVLPKDQKKSFAGARASIDKALAGLDEFNRLVPALNEIMGANGRRLYLVEQVNQAELRGGGGYIGTYSLISADHGVLKVESSGDTHELPDFGAVRGSRGYVPPPAPMVEFLKAHGWSLQDTNFFPQFADNARAAEDFSAKDFGTRLDGVISIDLSAVAAMMRVTGPLQVPGYSTPFTAENLIDQAILLDITDEKHKGVLNALAGPLMQGVTTLSSDQWPRLLAILNELASQRHLQVYFNSEVARSEMQRVSWTGDLGSDAAPDFVYSVESNFGGNKANYFLTRGYDLDLRRDGATLHHRLRIDLSLDVNKAPPTYNPFYRSYYRLYTKDTASDLRIRNVKAPDFPGTAPAGYKLIDGWQQLNLDRPARRGALQITYEWDTPWQPDASGRHNLYWQKQPGTLTDRVTVHFTNDGRTVTTGGDLGADRLLRLAPGGVTIETGHAGSAHLPGLSL